jgi:cyclophilin family peptidyl-prolyl cis-trans isomerase
MKNLLLPLYVVLAVTTARAGLSPVEEAEDLRRPEDPALLQAASSADPLDRARAALAWGRIQQPVGIDHLYPLLSDTDARVRRAAAFALGQFGWKPEFAKGREAEILAKLEPLAADSSQSVRIAAVEAMGKVGLLKTPDAVAPLLASAEAELRAEALMALYRYHLVLKLREPNTAVPDPSQPVMSAMLALEADGEALVRRNLVYYFARIKDPRGLPMAIRLAGDPETWVRYFSILAIQKSGDPSGEPAALAAASDSFYVIRVAAVNALAAIGKSADIPAALLQDPYFHVRAAIADALGTSDSSASIQTLGTLAQDRSPTVQGEALKSTEQRIKADSIPALKAATISPLWPVRAAAYEALGDLAPKNADAAQLELKGAIDEDPRAATSAVSALTSVPGDAAWQALKAAIESTEPAVRDAAIDGLGTRKDADLAQEAWHGYRIMPGNRWDDQRTSLIAILAAIPGDETTAELKQALGDDSQEVALAAAQALADRGIPVPAPNRGPTLSPFRNDKFTQHPFVILETTQGEIWIECYSEAAPIEVAGFVGMAKAGRYDGTSWHRVVSDFVVQGGSLDGSGWDNGDFAVRAEVNPLRFGRGAVGMPRADSFDSGSIQLFITHVPTPHLDGQYTVFGQVVQGLDTVDHLEVGDTILRARVIE